MRYRWLLALIGIVILGVAASGVARVRMPIAAGLFYPAETDKLAAAVRQYLDAAKVPELPGRYVACITPHSAYPYCGSVAAHAFKPLKRGQYDRVIILASSHFAEFRGCSIPSAQFYVTPLGMVELDGAAIGRLQWCPLVDIRSVTSKRVRTFNDGTKRMPLHEVEYSVEVLLPFLQAALGQFRLVPILVGTFEDYQGNLDQPALAEAAEAIREVVDDRTFVVASTDFTHYGPAYGYMPFSGNLQETIGDLDADAFELLLARDTRGFEQYLEDTDNNICGHTVLELFLRILPRGTQGVLLDYNISANITGSKDSSVSYGALAFFNPALAPPDVRPQPQPIMPPPAPVEPILKPSEGETPPVVPEGMARRGRANASDAAPQPRAERPSAEAKAEKGDKEKEGGIFRFFRRGDKKTHGDDAG
jgi:AmmeMemoRadiSam system protein B